MKQPILDVFNQVKAELYIGNNSAAKNLSLLKSRGITHILICASEIGPSFPDRFIYKKLNIQENFDFNISAYFDEAFEFIEQGVSEGSVLVHCAQGQSRSPAIVASYLIKKYHKNTAEALKIIKKKHPITEPNAGFVEQLTTYQQNIKENVRNPMTCTPCLCLIQ